MPARSESSLKGDVLSSEDAMLRCNELEAELAELRAVYEQYFLGNERLPPIKKHEQFKKDLNRVKSAMIRQTAAKFRLESISQKLLTYERLWDRSLKEIEAGTFKRDLARLRRKDSRRVEKKKSPDASDDFDVDDDLDLSDLNEGESDGDDLAAALKAAEAAVAKPAAAPAIKPVTGGVPAVAPLVTPAQGAPGIPAVRPLVTPSIPPVAAVAPAVKSVSGSQPAVAPPKITSGSFPAGKPTMTGSVPVFSAATSNPAMRAAAPASRPQAAAGDNGLSETKIKAIYDAYVMAKKRCGEDTRALTLDSVASSLKKQVPELMKQHNAKSVEFKVVIKDGKAVLRALPKE